MKALRRCARCGKCLPQCPSFKATLKENFSPRGRVALLEAGIRDPEAFSTCLLCGACESTCPNAIPLLKYFIEARWGGFRPFRPLFPLFFRGVHALRGKFVSDGAEIGLFLGCGAEFFYPAELRHFLKIFSDLEGELSIISGCCCGLPYLAAGDERSFRKEAQRTLSFLASKKVLLTLCASCLFTFKRLYPEFLGDEAQGIGALFRDGVAYLLRHGAGLNFEEKVFFQVPCHLRHSGEDPWWRKENWEIFEGCCGQAGTYGLFHPRQAGLIAKPLKKTILLAGARVLTSACSSCLFYLKRAFPGAKVHHVASLLTKRNQS